MSRKKSEEDSTSSLGSPFSEWLPVLTSAELRRVLVLFDGANERRTRIVSRDFPANTDRVEAVQGISGTTRLGTPEAASDVVVARNSRLSTDGATKRSQVRAGNMNGEGSQTCFEAAVEAVTGEPGSPTEHAGDSAEPAPAGEGFTDEEAAELARIFANAQERLNREAAGGEPALTESLREKQEKEEARKRADQQLLDAATEAVAAKAAAEAAAAAKAARAAEEEEQIKAWKEIARLQYLERTTNTFAVRPEYLRKYNRWF